MSTISKETLLNMLQNKNALNALEKSHIDNSIQFIHRSSFPFDKDNQSSHITASAWIIDTNKENVLLTYHKKLNRWLQLGGHIEPQDISVLAAAYREAREESGLTTLSLLQETIFDVDVHIIPAYRNIPEHYHYDIRFCFTAETEQSVIPTEESLDVAWIPLKDVSSITNNSSMERMVEKTLALKNHTPPH